MKIQSDYDLTDRVPVKESACTQFRQVLTRMQKRPTMMVFIRVYPCPSVSKKSLPSDLGPALVAAMPRREIRGFQQMETVSQKFPYFSMMFPGSFHVFPCVVERRMFVALILRLNRAMTAINQKFP